MFNSTPRAADPTTEDDFGNGFLMRHGYTVAWVGWQPDVPRRDGLMALDVPRAKGVTGFIRCELQPNSRVDSLALAEAIDRRAAAPQDVLVEVNVAGEASKAGVTPDALPALLDGLRGLAKLRCRGLMTVPPYGGDNRPHFRRLAELARAHALPELSMGMSDDFEVAIEEGATIVRVGTALFGPRET